MTFFDYSEKVKAVSEFGICDNKTEKEKPAFVIYENKDIWNAAIVSEMRDDFNFIAVDNNIPYNDKDVEHFDNVDGLNRFKFKKAYACNKARPFFNYQFKDRIQQFYNETGVNLRTEVLIKNIK